MLSDTPFDTRTEALFPRIILALVNALDPSKKTGEMYIKYMNLLNYAFVCGIGVLINQFVLHRLIGFMSLWIANMGAILVAFINNWVFSVGPFGYLFGLSQKREKSDE